jgi:small subunit ribosomal protein S16
VAVKLKLARHGAKGEPFYRIVASENGTKRDGRFIERIGTYNPMVTPAAVTFNEAKVQRWMSVGATPTEVVRRLLQKSFPGLVEKREDHQRSKIQAARKLRKERAKGKGAAKKTKK